MRWSINIAQLQQFFALLNHPRRDEIDRLKDFFSALKKISDHSEPFRSQATTPDVDFDAFRTFLEALHQHADTLAYPAEIPNVWNIARLRRDEVRNAAVLAWLLDARQSHGYGPRVLNALLSRLKARQHDNFPIPTILDGPYTVARECYSFGDGQNRVDLMVDTRDAVIIIEVKISAAERTDQVKDYLRVARQRAYNLGKSKSCVIYLTRERRSTNVVDDDLVLCDWVDVARAINDVVGRGAPISFSGQILKQLADHFRGF